MNVVASLYVTDTGKVQIVELKTRVHRSLPGRSQQQSHELQVMLYRYLMDKLIGGSLDCLELWKVLTLDPEKAFGKGVQEQINIFSYPSINCLEKLMSQMLQVARDVSEIDDSLRIEYTHQADGQTFADETVSYNEEWLLEQTDKFFTYWHGRRSAQGVDIEEAWKCGKCDFADHCQWRIRKAEELRQKSKANI